jgi:hypothetical protein
MRNEQWEEDDQEDNGRCHVLAKKRGRSYFLAAAAQRIRTKIAAMASTIKPTAAGSGTAE